MFFVQSRQCYQILSQKYEINNFNTIVDIFPIIHDRLMLNDEYKFTSINPIFLTSLEKTVMYQKELAKKTERITKYENIEYKYSNTQENFDNMLNSIQKIDFFENNRTCF